MPWLSSRTGLRSSPPFPRGNCLFSTLVMDPPSLRAMPSCALLARRLGSTPPTHSNVPASMRSLLCLYPSSISFLCLSLFVFVLLFVITIKILGALEDFTGPIAASGKDADDVKKAKRTAFLENGAPLIVKSFVSKLEKNQSGFLVGSSLTIAGTISSASCRLPLFCLGLTVCLSACRCLFACPRRLVSGCLLWSRCVCLAVGSYLSV